jgi:nicotinamidase-related amidase
MNSQTEFLDKNDCQLLLVDVQQSMLNTCVDAQRIGKRISVLIDFARIMEIPVIFTEQNSTKLGKFLPELVRKAENSYVLNKMEFGCFGNKSIDVALAKSGRKTILLAGIETHVCIFQTGVQGLQKEYRVHVAADAVSASTQLNHDVGLRRLEAAGAVISSVEMIIFELLERADFPQFRKTLPIIKVLKNGQTGEDKSI